MSQAQDLPVGSPQRDYVELREGMTIKEVKEAIASLPDDARLQYQREVRYSLVLRPPVKFDEMRQRAIAELSQEHDPKLVNEQMVQERMKHLESQERN